MAGRAVALGGLFLLLRHASALAVLAQPPADMRPIAAHTNQTGREVRYAARSDAILPSRSSRTPFGGSAVATTSMLVAASAVAPAASLQARAEAGSPKVAELALAMEPALVLAMQHPREKVGPSFDLFAVVYCFCIALLVAIVYATEDGSAFTASAGKAGNLGVPQSVLPQNLWALNLAAAVGQCSVRRRPLRPSIVACLSIFMVGLQCLALFLVANDINPNAMPVTVHPSTPWVHHGWSVNTMKWLMVVFLSLFMVAEAADCRVNLESVLVTNSKRFLVPKSLVFLVSSTQFVVVFLVVWCGVSAVLSFQAVPDILYSSMSVTFISRVDESFFKLLQSLVDIEADFTIIHGKQEDALSARQRLFRACDLNQDGVVTEAEMQACPSAVLKEFATSHHADEGFNHVGIPLWVQVGLRTLTVAPLALGFGLISRSFYTGEMPTDWMHVLKARINHQVGQHMS